MSQSKSQAKLPSDRAKKSDKTPDNRGRILILDHSSVVLKDNPLGDPFERPVNVYLPAAYDNCLLYTSDAADE